MRNKIHIALLACAACSSSSQQASNDNSNDSGDYSDATTVLDNDSGSQSGAGGMSSGSAVGISGSNAGSSGAGLGSSGSGSTGSSSGSGSTGSSGSSAASGAGTSGTGAKSGASSGSATVGGRGPRDAGPQTGPVDSGPVAVGDGSVGNVTAGPAGGSSSGCGKGGQASEKLMMITVGGTARTYDLILPAGYDGSTPQPLYFVYHGRDSDHTSVTPYGLQDSAIGVFPDGLNRNGVIGWDTSVGGADVAMFDAVLQAVEASTCVDQSRVYAAGFSFGASMANALGCFRGNVLRAFASAEGGILFGNGSNDCKGPIPGWINQNQQDQTVTYSEGLRAEQLFVALDSDSNPVTYDAPNPCVIYTGKDPVVWCTPNSAAHAWPDFATAAVKSFFASL